MFDVNKIREDFPILKRKVNGHDLVYFDSGATSQKPEAVIESMNKYYRNTNANIHRGVYEMSVESTRLVDETRSRVAEFIGGKIEEVIFTRNTSEGINLVAYSWGMENISKDDAVVISKLEHHSNLIPWQELCRLKGAELRVVDVDDEGVLLVNGKIETNTEDGLKVVEGGWNDLLDEKVKMVAITGQSNVLGTVTPIEEIVKMVRTKCPESVILIDGAQMVPHMKVNVSKLGADFLVFSAHKMLGPTGIGVLWGKKEVLEKMKPFLYGGDMIGEVSLTKTTWAELPSKFEAGTPDIAGIVGFGEAIKYLQSIGMDNIHEYEKKILLYALEKMEVLKNEGLVTLYGPVKSARGGAIAFNVEGVHAHDTAQILDNFGIAVRSGQHCAAPLVKSFEVSSMVRATFYLYNTKEEIDYFVEKIREVQKVFA